MTIDEKKLAALRKRRKKHTQTKSFGASRRETHDASPFYERKIFQEAESSPPVNLPPAEIDENWVNRLYCQSAEQLPLPDQSIGLAFTSPPYNVGKEYDLNQTLDEYLAFIQRVGREVYRTLVSGGRYVVNVANLGRKPYIPLHMYFFKIHQEIGFLPMGEIIWQKGRGVNNSCAWGSWRNARSPRLRDLHEYLLVFVKDSYSRPDRGDTDISAEEFLNGTRSIWDIHSAYAKRIGHPAPFPLELAERVIRLFSYQQDVILDPFMGSGTTCLAAKQLGRAYVGVDISPEYCELARQRLEKEGQSAEV